MRMHGRVVSWQFQMIMAMIAPFVLMLMIFGIVRGITFFVLIGWRTYFLNSRRQGGRGDINTHPLIPLLLLSSFALRLLPQKLLPHQALLLQICLFFHRMDLRLAGSITPLIFDQELHLCNEVVFFEDLSRYHVILSSNCTAKDISFDNRIWKADR